MTPNLAALVERLRNKTRLRAMHGLSGWVLAQEALDAEAAAAIESLAAAEARLLAAKQMVRQQAEDAGLWFVARTAAEAYLQQELRKLHGVIEGTPT